MKLSEIENGTLFSFPNWPELTYRKKETKGRITYSLCTCHSTTFQHPSNHEVIILSNTNQVTKLSHPSQVKLGL